MKSRILLAAGSAALLAALICGAGIVQPQRHEPGDAAKPPSPPPSCHDAAPMPTGERPDAVSPKSPATAWVRTDLKMLLGEALQTDRWDTLIAEVAARMAREPLAIVASLLDEKSLQEMRPVLLRMALEHCPPDQVEATANLILARCGDPGEKTSGLGTLLESVARSDPRRALRLIPLAALTTDENSCLSGVTGTLVDSLGGESISLLRPYCASMENGTSLLAGAIARLARTDVEAALRGIDSFADGEAAPRSESILAAAPVILVSGQAGEIVDWLDSQSVDSLTSDAWAELCLLLAASHPADAMKWSAALTEPRDRASLEERIRAISKGEQPPMLEIAADDGSREPVSTPSLE